MKWVLDVAHADIGDKTGRGMIDFIIEFDHRLEHVHVSDNCGHLDEHLPLGWGKIEFKRVADALVQVGYDKTITLEVFETDRAALVKSRLKLQKRLKPT